MSQNVPIGFLPFPYASGLALAWASNTSLTIGAGQARDANNVLDIILSNGVTLDATTTGVNGLDTGSLANNTWYAVYAITSSYNLKQPAVILSASASVPQYPKDYDSSKLIGWVLTDGSANFLKFYQSGNANLRQHYWDSMISVLSGGAATSLTNIDLSAAVPLVDSAPVLLEVQHTPNTGGDKVSFAPAGSVATLLPSLSGVVAAKAQTAQLKIVSKLSSSLPKIQYINSASSGSTSVWVYGFEYFL